MTTSGDRMMQIYSAKKIGKEFLFTNSIGYWFRSIKTIKIKEEFWGLEEFGKSGRGGVGGVIEMLTERDLS